MQSYRHPGAEWLGSPNFTPQRDGHEMAVPPAYVVIHTMVGTLEGADGRFQNAGQQASATYGIGLDGRLVQWVDEADAAWANGTLYDDPGSNVDSISIEHEDDGNANDVVRTPAQYRASALLVRDVCQRYAIPIDRQHVLQHKQCVHAATSCPDGLDVDRIVRLAAGTEPLPDASSTGHSLPYQDPHAPAGQLMLIDFTGVTFADPVTGEYASPDRGAPTIGQVGPGTTLSFRGYMHIGPPLSGPQDPQDDRWFLGSAGGWYASVDIDGNPPWLGSPASQPPAPAPAPAPTPTPAPTPAPPQPTPPPPPTPTPGPPSPAPADFKQLIQAALDNLQAALRTLG